MIIQCHLKCQLYQLTCMPFKAVTVSVRSNTKLTKFTINKRKTNYLEWLFPEDKINVLNRALLSSGYMSDAKLKFSIESTN